jgi:hypothetical protein
MKAKIIFLAIISIFIVKSGFSQDTIKAADAKKYIDNSVVVIGKVAEIKKTEKMIYVNVDGKYPDNNFTAVVFAKNFGVFPDIDTYLDKMVEIFGTVIEYNGKPEIILESAYQLKMKVDK